MSIANSRDLDELCYPFIHETSWLCDYELLTDELCAQIGAVLSALPVTYEDIYTGSGLAEIQAPSLSSAASGAATGFCPASRNCPCSSAARSTFKL